MQGQDMYYGEERRYANVRLTLLFILTFFSFILFENVNIEMASKVFLVKMTFVALLLISMTHYLLMINRPHVLLMYRKILLILIDLVALTFFIALFEENGLFLLPIYILIVMQNGLSFGIVYFYASIISAATLWILLLVYSEYWRVHYDIIATFAMTTFLIPLFYLRFISKAHNDNDELSEILTTTEYDANHDSLTGLKNRKVYKEELQERLKSKEFFALIFIDLNKFKAINDTYGHHIGDDVLREVAKRLQESISSNDFLARLGGDEFVIISSRQKVFLPKFIKNLEKITIGKHTIDDITVLIELSIGISFYPEDTKNILPGEGSVEMMLGKYADNAMYAAKSKRNVYHVYYRDIKS